MSKKILFRLAILLTVVALVYGMFWFFKVGQVQNQINSFISANSSQVLISDVSAAGFPLAQKIIVKDLSFTIPNPLLNKKQVVIKNVILMAKVFSSEFTVSFPEAPTLRDIDGNVYTVEFTSDPEIKVSFQNGKIANLSYKDSGYRVLDAQKNVVYAASSSALNFELKEEGEKISAKVVGNIKDVEGFGVMEVYKNAFEKGLIEGVKTGEIVVGAAATPAAQDVAPAVVTPAPAVAPAPVVAATPAADASVPATPAPVDQVAAAPEPAQDAVTSVPDNNLVKSNLMFEIEYSLTPAEAKKEEAASGLPQIQSAPDQHFNRVTKIHNLDFSNPLYRISINGEINSSVDDESPSGSLAIKVENVTNLVNYVKLAIGQMTDQSKIMPAQSAVAPASTEAGSVAVSADNQAQNPADAAATSAPADQAVVTPVASETPVALAVTPTPVADDAYTSFLKRVATSLPAITQEIAAKNPVSKDNVAQFDVRREKNLEFLVNETSLREIIGKM